MNIANQSEHKSLKNKIICAIDTTSIKEALHITEEIKGLTWGVKLGMEFFYSCGVEGLKEIASVEENIFLDLKLHDIPQTVYNTVCVIQELGIKMLTVHISGGAKMLEAALEAANDQIQILGVTLLTSLSQSDIDSISPNSAHMSKYIEKMSILAKTSGINGIVCSALEARIVKSICQDSALIVCPGIRLNHNNSNDHSRYLDPKQALANGADYLVIGRPITKSEDPKKCVEQIINNM